MEEGGGRAADRLLEALDKRTTELESMEISDIPERHSQICFETVTDDDLIAKANELVGTVIPCEASAQHSFIEGNKNKSSRRASPPFLPLLPKMTKESRWHKVAIWSERRCQARQQRQAIFHQWRSKTTATVAMTFTAQRRAPASTPSKYPSMAHSSPTLCPSRVAIKSTSTLTKRNATLTSQSVLTSSP